MENDVNNGKVIDNEVGNEARYDDEVETKDGLGKKIIKIGLKVLVCLATGVAGFFIGRATNGDDDDDNTESNDAETDTVE